MQQELLERLDALQKELDELGESISEGRSGQLRRQVLEDLRALLGEYNREVLEAELDRLEPASACRRREACLSAIRTTLEEASSAFEGGDYEQARASVARLAGAKAVAPCEDSACSVRAEQLMQETSRMIEISSRLEGSMSEQMARPDVPDSAVGDALMPLAHGARISILAALSSGSMAFSEMSREVGLRTGHLQFHLRTLIASGMVEKESKRGHYRMTEKGRKALAGSRRLATEIA
jgi:DNA-binding HxlR family transcriptional regulator